MHVNGPINTILPWLWYADYASDLIYGTVEYQLNRCIIPHLNIYEEAREPLSKVSAKIVPLGTI